MLVKKAVNRAGDGVAYACGRADHVGARTQMRDFTQELHGVRLRRDRVGVRIIDPANDLDRGGLHFKWLPFGGRRHDQPGSFDGAASGEFLHFFGVIDECIRHNDLHRMKARAIGHVDERNTRLGIATGFDPTLDRNGNMFVAQRRFAGEDVETAKMAHELKLFLGDVYILVCHFERCEK